MILSLNPTLTKLMILSRVAGLCSRAMSTQVAVVLSGCGVYDGTEVHEASAVLTHLSRHGAEVAMFAPDKDQMHVIDHTAGAPMEETRNVLKESARIARGNISALQMLDVEKFDILLIPGGFGAAKNLSSFATKGANMTVDAGLAEIVKKFHADGKAIGMCCIAPTIAAKLIPGVEVTVGGATEEDGKWPYSGTAGAIEAMGGVHVVTTVDQCHVDSKHKVVTTAAYMCNTAMHEIYDGIGEMVSSVLKLSKD